MTLESWHCPGSGQTSINRQYGIGICRGCGRKRSLRLDGLVPKHPKPGEYHPNKAPKEAS